MNQLDKTEAAIIYEIKEENFFLFYSRRYLNRRKDAEGSLLDELDDLLGSEFFAAIRAELVGKSSQAFEAESMATEEDTLLSLIAVVFFQANFALVAIVLGNVYYSKELKLHKFTDIFNLDDHSKVSNDTLKPRTHRHVTWMPHVPFEFS